MKSKRLTAANIEAGDRSINMEAVDR